MQSHILFSYDFDQKGKVRRLRDEEVAEDLSNENMLTWVHLDGNSSESKSWLEKEVSYLDHLIIDALIAEETRPRVMEFENGLLIILRGMNLKSTEDFDEMASIRLWVDKYRVISIQRQNFSSVFNLAQKLDQGKSISKSGELLYNLLYEILSLISPAVIDLNEHMDVIEDKVLETHNEKLREAIILIRKHATIFKRYMVPQKDVINRLKASEVDFIDDWAKRHFQENFEQVTRIVEEIDEARERSQIVHDELTNSIADRLNKSMFKVSLVTSIFMPLGFITGLFGMNVGGIPWNQQHDGFFIVSIIIFFVFLGNIFLFKNKKWF